MTDTPATLTALGHPPGIPRLLPGDTWAQVSEAVLHEACCFPAPGELLRQAGDLAEGSPRFCTFESPKGVQLLVRGIGRFWVDPSGVDIRYQLEDGCPEQDAMHVLTGPVIGMAMQLAGKVVLHASGFVFGGLAVAMSAPSGMGKSTLCAAFGRAGYRLMADDMLVLDAGPDRLVARSYVPQIKLWDDSVGAFGEAADGFVPVLSWIEKRKVLVNGRWGTVANGAFPLGAVYMLRPSSSPETTLAITALAPAQAVLHVLAGMYMPETLRGARSVAALDAATRIANSVPVRVVSYYRSFENLPAIRDAIVRDAEGIACRGE